MAFTWIRGQQANQLQPSETDDERANALSSIRLRVEDGLLMAFGPDGDPVPPALLHTACTESAVDGPTMEDGTVVDRKKVLAIIDAQQRGQLADQSNDGWIEAMLGLGGEFESTPDDLLKTEPEDDLPPMPKAATARRPTASVPLTFDETEQAAMANADALLLRGLSADMSLSIGQYDPSIDSWVLRPDNIAGLEVQRKHDEPNAIDLEVTAIMIGGKGEQRPITTRRIDFTYP